MRSAVSIAAFLLLDCLRASADERKPLVLAAASPNYHELFQQIIHTSWLGPGLFLAILLVLLVSSTGSTHKPRKRSGLVRKFRAPKLDQYRDTFPKDHEDLEV